MNQTIANVAVQMFTTLVYYERAQDHKHKCQTSQMSIHVTHTHTHTLVTLNHKLLLDLFTGTTVCERTADKKGLSSCSNTGSKPARPGHRRVIGVIVTRQGRRSDCWREWERQGEKEKNGSESQTSETAHMQMKVTEQKWEVLGLERHHRQTAASYDRVDNTRHNLQKLFLTDHGAKCVYVQ